MEYTKLGFLGNREKMSILSEKAGKVENNRRKGETYEKKDKNLNHTVKTEEARNEFLKTKTKTSKQTKKSRILRKLRNENLTFCNSSPVSVSGYASVYSNKQTNNQQQQQQQQKTHQGSYG